MVGDCSQRQEAVTESAIGTRLDQCTIVDREDREEFVNYGRPWLRRGPRKKPEQTNVTNNASFRL